MLLRFVEVVCRGKMEREKGGSQRMCLCDVRGVSLVEVEGGETERERESKRAREQERKAPTRAACTIKIISPVFSSTARGYALLPARHSTKRRMLRLGSLPEDTVRKERGQKQAAFRPQRRSLSDARRTVREQPARREKMSEKVADAEVQRLDSFLLDMPTRKGDAVPHGMVSVDPCPRGRYARSCLVILRATRPCLVPRSNRVQVEPPAASDTACIPDADVVVLHGGGIQGPLSGLGHICRTHIIHDA